MKEEKSGMRGSNTEGLLRTCLIHLLQGYGGLHRARLGHYRVKGVWIHSQRTLRLSLRGLAVCSSILKSQPVKSCVSPCAVKRRQRAQDRLGHFSRAERRTESARSGDLN
ncbi:hypothetical protein SKAU_G00325470 [Synaphobranchus kaupii]|uniref:Uncharacterized protein n=1 Tax=Synaphobranchus kaupii TaxID=118154 RepID=A0A9Q1EPM3_SYNKA|nr:hypothetical protein SKAU_G00325470 [Synaphobranchus kaupii]